MIVRVCQHPNRKKYGKTRAGTTRYRCKDCGKCFTESTELLAGMRIGLNRAGRIVEMLLEGLSVSTVARLTKTKPHTIIDLMVLVGQRCEDYLRTHHRKLKVNAIQADEIWSYIGCKSRTVRRLGYQDLPVGDCYCYTAIDPESKLLVCFHFGVRDQENTDEFCRKLWRAVDGQFKLSTDGYFAYEPAVGWYLPGRTDYGQIIKLFYSTRDDELRFGSGTIVSVRKRRIFGKIDFDEICTSHCERLNATIRNYTKRMARCTYAFSKKWENHQAALALFFMAYNYTKPHKTLKKQTPAMAHGLSDHVWSIRELLVKTSNT